MRALDKFGPNEQTDEGRLAFLGLLSEPKTAVVKNVTPKCLSL